jgi:DNA-binding response OmpR family regulator
MPIDKQILSIAEDESVRRTKHMLLEQIGFSVVSVGTLREVEYVINKSKFDLIILGRGVNQTLKRSVADASRRSLPGTPILELCNVSPVITGAEYVLRNPGPDDLAELVKSIFHPKSPK